MDETPERLYDEREKRVTDAIELRTPDRVPIIVGFHFFPAKYTGATAEELMYDPRKTEESYWKVIRDFEPDMIQNPFERFLGPLLDALDCRQARWPGRNLPAHLPYQFVEQEYMKGGGIRSSSLRPLRLYRTPVMAENIQVSEGA